MYFLTEMHFRTLFLVSTLFLTMDAGLLKIRRGSNVTPRIFGCLVIGIDCWCIDVSWLHASIMWTILMTIFLGIVLVSAHLARNLQYEGIDGCWYIGWGCCFLMQVSCSRQRMLWAVSFLVGKSCNVGRGWMTVVTRFLLEELPILLCDTSCVSLCSRRRLSTC